jgi:hypothetical protein
VAKAKGMRNKSIVTQEGQIRRAKIVSSAFRTTNFQSEPEDKTVARLLNTNS